MQKNLFFNEVKKMIVENYLCSSTVEEEIELLKEVFKSNCHDYEIEMYEEHANALTAQHIQELQDCIDFNERLFEEKEKENLGGFKILDNRGRKVARLY